MSFDSFHLTKKADILSCIYLNTALLPCATNSTVWSWDETEISNCQIWRTSAQHDLEYSCRTEKKLTLKLLHLFGSKLWFNDIPELQATNSACGLLPQIIPSMFSRKRSCQWLTNFSCSFNIVYLLFIQGTPNTCTIHIMGLSLPNGMARQRLRKLMVN